MTHTRMRVKIRIRPSLVFNIDVKLLKLTESVLDLFMFVSCLNLLSPLGHSSTLDKCESSFNYRVETQNGWKYLLIILGLSLRMSSMMGRRIVKF